MLIPKGMKGLYSDATIVEVKLEKCRDWQGYSYTEDGWHYFSALIKEYLENPALTYEESILRKYYKKFQPKSWQECFCFDEEEQLQPISRGWPPLPWEAAIKNNIGKSVIIENSINDNQHYGPNSDVFGRKEFERTINIYKKLEKEGYQPESNRDGYIRGYYLKKKNDYRFKVTAGQHRIAALGILSYENIKVRIQKNTERVVDIKNIKNWPNVCNGEYDVKLAIQIFEYYFNKNGREKAKKIGLL